MKITATYMTWEQTSPDGNGRSYIKVIHLDQDMTLAEAYKKITHKWTMAKRVDVELHFENPNFNELE